MNYLLKLCDRLGILRSEIDYHVLRASMVLIFLFFGYQKWWVYEAQALVPYISNGPLIFWMYPVFGIRGATWFLGGRSGCSAPSYSGDSGTKRQEFSARSAELLHSCRPRRSFRSSRMAGQRPPVDFQQ